MTPQTSLDKRFGQHRGHPVTTPGPHGSHTAVLPGEGNPRHDPLVLRLYEVENFTRRMLPNPFLIFQNHTRCVFVDMQWSVAGTRREMFGSGCDG